MDRVSAIIVAAGESRRMEGIDKVFAPLDGKPLIAWVIEAFERCSSVDEIVVVVNETSLEKCRILAAREKWSKVTGICAGGERRQDSVMSGLHNIRDYQWLVVHDGARPLVTEDIIQRGLVEAGETGSAVAAVPVTDTIKLADDDRLVENTLPRHNLWSVQTPQVFRSDIINEAYRKLGGDVTDDASLVEQSGYKVKLYMGSYDNIKVTTPADLALAELLLQRRER